MAPNPHRTFSCLLRRYMLHAYSKMLKPCLYTIPGMAAILYVHLSAKRQATCARRNTKTSWYFHSQLMLQVPLQARKPYTASKLKSQRFQAKRLCNVFIYRRQSLHNIFATRELHYSVLLSGYSIKTEAQCRTFISCNYQNFYS